MLAVERGVWAQRRASALMVLDSGVLRTEKTRASLRSPIQRRLQQGHKFYEWHRVSKLLLDEIVVTEYTTADRRDDLMSSTRPGRGTRCDLDGELMKLALIQILPWCGSSQSLVALELGERRRRRRRRK